MTSNTTWEKFENNLLNKGLTKKRIDKLRSMYNLVARTLTTPLETATREDLEQFVTDIHRNKVRKLSGEALSGSTKADIKRFLKQFFKWLKGKDEFFPSEVTWIRTSISKDEQPEEKPTLSLTEALQFASAFKKTEYRILTLLLFDSGFRINEMLSAKKTDLSWEDFGEGEKCFWLKCNASKTELRKVPVPLFTEHLRDFVNSSYYLNLGNDEPLFNLEYSNILTRFGQVSQQLFNKTITPHALRHSSATFYAKEFDGNMNSLAERYGWTYSSDQLKTYIRRSGAYQRSGAKKVFTNELLSVKAENARLKERMEKMEGDVRSLLKLMSPDLLEKSKEQLLDEEKVLVKKISEKKGKVFIGEPTSEML